MNKDPYITENEMKKLLSVHKDINNLRSITKYLVIIFVPLFICLGAFFVWIVTSGKISNIIEARTIIGKYALLEKSPIYKDIEKKVMNCANGMEKILKKRYEMYSEDKKINVLDVECIASQMYIYRKINNKDENFDFVMLSVMAAESEFNKKSSSPKGARGIMQLMPTTFKWIVKDKLFVFENVDIENVYYNVEAGIWYWIFCENYLKSLMKRKPTLKEIGYAYNGGHNSVPWEILTEKNIYYYVSQESREYGDKINFYYTNYIKDKYDVYYKEMLEIQEQSNSVINTNTNK